MNARKIAIAILALGALLVPATQASAAPGPAWTLNASALPGNLVPGAEGTGGQGPEFLLVATNVGGAATSAPITIGATLSDDLSPVAAEVGKVADGDPATPAPNCTVAPHAVTCTTPGPVNPGRTFGILIPVDVSLAASGTELLEASISGGGAAPAAASVSAPVSTTAPSFGFLPGAAGLSAFLTEADGAPAVQAGSHPYQQTVHLGFPVRSAGGFLDNAGHPRDILTDLPRGMIVNPTATPVLCTEAQLVTEGAKGGGCPAASQLGIATVETLPLSGAQPLSSPLFNMVAPPGTPALLGFNAAGLGIFVHIAGAVRSDGDFGLSALSKDIPALAGHPTSGVSVQLWGDPSSSSHDQIRGECKSTGGSCKVDPQKTALLTMPSQCTGPISTAAQVDSWEQPGVFDEASYESTDLEGTPVGVSGCALEEFEPTISATPTTSLADSPSGLDFNLHQPQDTELGHIAPANLRDATVTLPEGMVVNPASANGQEACSSAQIGLTTPIGATPIHFSKAPDDCPQAAKIGSVQVTTPLLDHPLPGAVYLAKPFDNPFDSLLAIYLSVDDPQSGTIAKFAGRVSSDASTGQLSTRVTESPELPIEDIDLHLFTGARASLITPQLCGHYTTTSELTPWSAPEGADAHPSDSFQTSAAPGGGSCPTSGGQAPNAPAFEAGTEAPAAGAFSPFVLKLSREDGSQRLSGFDTTLPPGLTGKLAGVSICSDAQIAQATSRSNPNEGNLEKSNPSCPASSELGVVNAGAGAGPTPLYVTGHAYLSGPYKGAPLSMVVITPAVAGPFDLGVVVVRAALYLDPVTAQIHAVSDPFPTILHGIPLDLRSVSVELTRNRFTLNPTSCERFSIAASATSALGSIAGLSNPFQVGGCKGLGFEPKLSLRLKGGTKRAAHPKLIATLIAREGDANIASAQVKLPRSAFLDQAHIRTICTRVQFAADSCPQGSIYGKASVKTPLLDNPLSGNVYLRSSNHKLPDLVIDLKGPVSQPIEVELSGRTDSVKGALRNTFEAAPDAPISKFRLELFGGNRGLVVNSRNLCAHPYRASAHFTGQNGKVHDSGPKVGVRCGKGRAKRRGGAH